MRSVSRHGARRRGVVRRGRSRARRALRASPGAHGRRDAATAGTGPQRNPGGRARRRPGGTRRPRVLRVLQGRRHRHCCCGGVSCGETCRAACPGRTPGCLRARRRHGYARGDNRGAPRMSRWRRVVARALARLAGRCLLAVSRGSGGLGTVGRRTATGGDTRRPAVHPDRAVAEWGSRSRSRRVHASAGDGATGSQTALEVDDSARVAAPNARRARPVRHRSRGKQAVTPRRPAKGRAVFGSAAVFGFCDVQVRPRNIRGPGFWSRRGGRPERCPLRRIPTATTDTVEQRTGAAQENRRSAGAHFPPASPAAGTNGAHDGEIERASRNPVTYALTRKTPL